MNLMPVEFRRNREAKRQTRALSGNGYHHLPIRENPLSLLVRTNLVDEQINLSLWIADRPAKSSIVKPFFALS
jgi:hypothetical protein